MPRDRRQMPIPASREGIIHHADQHACDADVVHVLCPCRSYIVLVCSECDEPLFVVTPGAWCIHAEQLYGERDAA